MTSYSISRTSLGSWLWAIIFLAAARPAVGVDLPPGGSVSLPGLAGGSGTVIHDQLIDFEIRSTSGALLFAGRVQNRVVRMDATGTLSFRYQIRDTQTGLSGHVVQLRTEDFAGFATNVDYSSTGTGTVAPSMAARSPDGKTVAFFFSTPLTAGQRSRFMHVDTDAVQFTPGGATVLQLGSGPSVTLPTVQPLLDCNGNGSHDPIDVSSSTSEDLNGNGVPDECEDASLLVTPRITQALQQLLQESLVPAKVLFTRGALPIPHFVQVKVPIPPTVPPDPLAKALDFLIRHRHLYDLTDPLAQLYPKRIVTDSDGVAIFLGQRRDAVAVHDASLVVRLDANQNHVRSTHGYYVPGLAALPSPAVLPHQAVDIAINHVPGQTAQLRADPRLMYFNEGLSRGDPGQTRLAWRVMLRGPGTTWRYFVDAHDGSVLSALDLIPTAGKDFDFYTANDTNSNICWDFSFGADDTTFWFDEDGPSDDYPNCAEACPANCAAGVPNCDDLGCDTDGDNMYCFAHEVYDYFNDTFDWDSFDNDFEEVEAYVHIGSGSCPNSWADGGEECLKFCDATVSLDIFGHEFTHLIIDETSGLPANSGQAGALNEHYADFFGAMVDGDWNVGNGATGFGGGCVNIPGGGTIPGTIRNMANPGDCGDPDHMLAALDTGGRGLCSNANDWCDIVNQSDNAVHENTGIPNKAAFLITDGGTHTGLVIDGIGREKAEQLYFKVMRYLPSNAQFIDQQADTVAKAQEWAEDGDHGFTDADVCSVINAFASVGLGDADLDCDGVLDPDDPDADGDDIDDDEDLCPGLASWGNVDTDDDELGDPCDPDNDNDGILDDGDGSGVEGDNRCRGGVGINCDDNCPIVFNEFQQDSDSDARGEVCDDSDRDGVMDAFDNCRTTANAGQGDVDGDCPDPLPWNGGNCGDACDTDADSDGILDNADGLGFRHDDPCTGGDTTVCDDNCPLVVNPNQADADVQLDGDLGDGVGDVCDNCAGAGTCDLAYNPSQGNTDGDACGDECDDDDDNDGVDDFDDNCPFQDNPEQIDLDGNGIGLACDEQEAWIFDGLPDLNGEPVFAFIAFPEVGHLLRIPVSPCAAANCPGYLGEGTRTVVTATLPFADMPARISDDRGFAVARAELGVTARSFDFAPAADFHFVPPSLPSQAAGTPQGPYRGTRYFLELGASPQMASGQSYQISVGVRTIDISVPATPLAESGGILKNRALSFSVPAPSTAGPATETALRVKLLDLQNPQPPNAPCCPPPNFGAFEFNTCTAPGEANGCARWVGKPAVFLESQDNPGLGNYRAARLQCTPFYHDWASEALIHVIGAEIMPSSTYAIESLAESCAGNESACTAVSTALQMQTARAGDIASPFQGAPPLTQPNAIDVTNAVNKFRNLAGAPPKVVAQVQPNFPDPNSDINAIDVVTVVDNVRGFGYTYSGPCVCPSSVPCNATACAGASACTGLYGAGATCIKTCSSGPRAGQPCNNNLNCGSCIGGPANGAGAAGIPCDANADCASNNCAVGVCPSGATPGFCRDRCGRCN